MIASARILHQLLQTDRLFGVEAVVRAPWVTPSLSPATIRPEPAKEPVPRGLPTPLAPRPAPPAARADPAAVWQTALEMPLAVPAAALRVLFISIEWGNPLTGEMRALFERQVAAMKLAPNRVGLLRMTWTGTQEPPAEALAQAKTEAEAAAGDGRPDAVVLFGGFSLRAVQAKPGIGSLTMARGRWFEWPVAGRAIPTCATWHPCQLGMDRDRRAQTWADLQAVCAKLAS